MEKHSNTTYICKLDCKQSDLQVVKKLKNGLNEKLSINLVPLFHY